MMGILILITIFFFPEVWDMMVAYPRYLGVVIFVMIMNIALDVFYMVLEARR